MAWQRLPGNGLVVPVVPFYATAAVAITASNGLTALGHKFAVVGDFCHPAKTGTKAIRKIHTRIGTNTSFVGTLTGYVQGVSTTSGGPATPDGSTTSGGAFSTLTAATWQASDAFGTDYTATIGDRIAVVLEITAFTSGSIAPSSGITDAAPSGFMDAPQRLLYTTSWARSMATMVPNFILECSDGTFGTIEGCFPCEAVGSVAYANNTAAADEYALDVEFPFPCKADACWAWMNVAAHTNNFEFVLYGSTTATKAIDANQVNTTSSTRMVWARFSDEVTLNANTRYRLSLKPVTTGNVSLMYFDVNAVGHLDAHDGGQNFRMVDRVDAGSWGTTNSNSGKRRPFMGLRLTSFDDGAGSGGLAMPVSGRIIA